MSETRRKIWRGFCGAVHVADFEASGGDIYEKMKSGRA
jgi:hypothetical protein